MSDKCSELWTPLASCCIVNPLYTKEQVFLLPDKPELKCPSNYTALEDAPHNLSCTVEGFPKPEVMWFKDEDDVALPESLTRSDTGQYVITASNNLSSINVTVEIYVVCKLFWWKSSIFTFRLSVFLYYDLYCFTVVCRPTIPDSRAWRLRSWCWFRCVVEVLLNGQPTTKLSLGLLSDCQCGGGKWRWSVPSAHP